MPQRMVDTSIWKKSRKFRRCDPLEKLLFMHLITCDELELCGIYEYELDDLSHYTGIDHRTVPVMMDKLQEVGLAGYHDGWIVVFLYLLKQKLTNKFVRIGIQNSLKLIPDVTMEWALEHGYVSVQAALQRRPIGDLLDLDLDLDSDQDLEVDLDSESDRDREKRKATTITFEIPKGTPPARCKSCPAQVYWIKTNSGANMLVNADGVSHFATCPDAKKFRRTS